MTQNDPTMLLLLYFVLPVWLLAGISDWLCHRKTNIETTTGTKETFIHILMFIEVGVPLLAAIFMEVNALIIGLMIMCFFLHEATALWDVSYAVTAREVSPIEQHVHSFLEMVPLMALLLVISRHWEQFLSLFGFGPTKADFSLSFKSEPLPVSYVAVLLTAILLLEVVPYLEELVRCRRQRKA
ncbi:diguanylate cyclase [Franconibacter helveticus]|uniref:diguanylate cyclase n=1 Tax=Franconibacter helveticus TaxID=357240 RepID=UPI000DA126D9|nr:diguanylate cyclase [Franconibacter helveticus]